ncbi:MAG: Rab family GTPase [Promethearchaeota archaeon]
MVDGYGGVGKTTMLKKLEYGVFDPETRLTIGIDFFAKKINLFGHNVTAQFWDLVGAARFNFLRPICYKGANCIILVADLTRPITFERIDYFIDVAKQVNIKPSQIILAGAKTDLYYERSVDSYYLSNILEKLNISESVETSARNNHNLDELFELATALALFHKGMITENEYIFIKEEIKQRIQEPIPEPYEKLIRKCWKCGKSLFFHEFSDSNNKIYSEDRLLELWESPFLEFFCCACYKELNSK